MARNIPVRSSAEARWARVAAFCVIALGFGLRVFFIPAARQNFDRGFPHGLGLFILDAIARGDWSGLPQVSLDSTIGLANPAGASYAWALVGLFDRSAYAATAVSAMLSVVGLAMIFDLARRFLSPWPAVTACALAAVSAWAITFADGAWVQGQLEFCAVCSAWVLWIGLRDANPGRVFVGLAVTALLTQTYVVAYVLVLQAAVACVLCLRRSLLIPIAAGLAVCLGMFGAHMLASQGSPQAALSFWSRFQTAQSAQAQSVSGVDLSGLDHARRLVTARDSSLIGATGASPDTTPFLELRRGLGDARATALDLALLAGVGLAIWRMRDPRQRLMLAWFSVPVAAAIVVASLREGQLVHPFYLLTTAPAGVMLAAAPLSRLRGRRAALPVTLILMLSALAPVSDILLRADFARKVLYAGPAEGMYGLNLGELSVLQREWRAFGCDAVAIYEDDPLNQSKSHSPNWARSLVEPLPYAGDEVWRVTPGGQAFMMPQSESLCVAGLDSAAWISGRGAESPLGEAILRTQRLSADVPAGPLPDPLDTNIGWQLIGLEAPRTARAGDRLTIRHVWRVNSLPDEPHGAWYFAPFAKLIDGRGAARASQDGAPSIIGYAWQPGNLIISDLVLNVPADLPAGDYALELSLFDPNQAKNAVYFDPAQPGTPQITIRRAVQVTLAP